MELKHVRNNPIDRLVSWLETEISFDVLIMISVGHFVAIAAEWIAARSRCGRSNLRRWLTDDVG